MKFRPVSTPLVTVDPFFSIWSCDDALYGGPTEHWSGRPCPILAGIYVGSSFYSMGAFDLPGTALHSRIYQTDCTLTPTSTTYTFENKFASVQLTFTTPLLLDRPDILARPVSYVHYAVTPKCDKPIRFVFGISSRACIDKTTQSVQFKKTSYSLACGNICQTPLAQSGDNVMIDWGWLHLCDPDARVGRFVEQEAFEALPINQTYRPYVDHPYLLTIKPALEGVITLAYDEINPIAYFGKPLNEYYTKYFSDFEGMLKAAITEYGEIKAACDAFDAALMAEAGKYGEDYRNITTLAYRQAVSAHKLVEDEEGNLLFLSKENDSNGCIGTLDVTYPSIPLFLRYNPEFVKGMLRPIIRYAQSPEWPFEFTPHDVGQYPRANGQVYSIETLYLRGPNGRSYGAHKVSQQMPVEEAGNMLLCLAAVKKYSGGDDSLFRENSALMKQWADYLVKYGYDPENQLCTDDFAGHLSRNCNLSLKAILGIAAYGELAGDAEYSRIAADYARRWETDAVAAHGATRLAFGDEDGWSLKYNIVWDNLLGYRLFSDEIKQREIAFYETKFNRYGVPLDNRAAYTKIDWLMWSTRIWDDETYFARVCESIVNMINETTDRVPLTDWYFTDTAAYRNFRGRSVVGGLFIRMI